jgi:hypothetical protein
LFHNHQNCFRREGRETERKRKKQKREKERERKEKKEERKEDSPSLCKIFFGGNPDPV